MIALLLINEPVVIETVIVPSLLNQFHSSDIKQQTKAICALGKLGTLASRSDTLPLLADLIQSSQVDKTLLIATIRSMGEKGELTLTKMFKKVKNPKLKSTICFFLGQKVPVEFADHIEIMIYE